MSDEDDEKIGRDYFHSEGRRQFGGMTPAGWEELPQELKERWIMSGKAYNAGVINGRIGYVKAEEILEISMSGSELDELFGKDRKGMAYIPQRCKIIKKDGKLYFAELIEGSPVEWLLKRAKEPPDGYVSVESLDMVGWFKLGVEKGFVKLGENLVSKQDYVSIEKLRSIEQKARKEGDHITADTIKTAILMATSQCKKCALLSSAMDEPTQCPDCEEAARKVST